MKTIIKYELVINEALRSALNYHTPDEQINEFIRFFGRHIGSDRIYIFEDCKESHSTDNTYEWCAEGVIPEIDRLQNINNLVELIENYETEYCKGKERKYPLYTGEVGWICMECEKLYELYERKIKTAFIPCI